jgi:hypothetical protein
MITNKKGKPKTPDEQAEESVRKKLHDFQEYGWLELTDPDPIKHLEKIIGLMAKHAPEMLPDILEYAMLKRTDPSKALHKLMELTEKYAPTHKETKKQKKTKKTTTKQNKKPNQKLSPNEHIRG